MFRHEFMTHSTFKANEVPMKGWKDCVTKKGNLKSKCFTFAGPMRTSIVNTNTESKQQ